jgi:hypothetical protein
MKIIFNPLPFLFVRSEIVDESPAPAALAYVEGFDRHMLKISAAISTDAHAAYLRQRSELINAALLRATAEMCAALRSVRLNQN